MNSTSVTPAIISQITSVTSSGINASRRVRTLRRPALVRVGELVRELARNRVELLAAAIGRHAGLQPAERERPRELRGSCDEPASSGIHSLLIVGKVKPGRHHADHDVRLAVDQDRLPMMRGSAAISAGPQIEAEHDDRTGTRAIVLCGEAAPAESAPSPAAETGPMTRAAPR